MFRICESARPAGGPMRSEIDLCGPTTQLHASMPCSTRSTSSCGTARCFLLLVFAMTAILSGCAKEAVVAAPSAPEVEVASVTKLDVPVYTECISSLDG